MLDELTAPRLNVPPLWYVVFAGRTSVITTPVAGALPTFVAVIEYCTVSPGAAPMTALATAPPLPLKLTVGMPVQPLPLFVSVTPVTAYGPESEETGFVLTVAMTPLQLLPLMVTVGGLLYEPPLVTLTKTTRSPPYAVEVAAAVGLPPLNETAGLAGQPAPSPVMVMPVTTPPVRVAVAVGAVLQPAMFTVGAEL